MSSTTRWFRCGIRSGRLVGLRLRVSATCFASLTVIVAAGCSHGVVELAHDRALESHTPVTFIATMRRTGTRSGVCIVAAPPYTTPMNDFRTDSAVFRDTSRVSGAPILVTATFGTDHGIVKARWLGWTSGSFVSGVSGPETCLAPVSDSTFSSVTLVSSARLPARLIYWESFTPRGFL